MEGGLITPPALIGTGPLMGVTSDPSMEHYLWHLQNREETNQRTADVLLPAQRVVVGNRRCGLDG
jgi:hypothetical protein